MIGSTGESKGFSAQPSATDTSQGLQPATPNPLAWIDAEINKIHPSLLQRLIRCLTLKGRGDFTLAEKTTIFHKKQLAEISILYNDAVRWQKEAHSRIYDWIQPSRDEENWRLPSSVSLVTALDMHEYVQGQLAQIQQTIQIVQTKLSDLQTRVSKADPEITTLYTQQDRKIKQLIKDTELVETGYTEIFPKRFEKATEDAGIAMTVTPNISKHMRLDEERKFLEQVMKGDIGKDILRGYRKYTRQGKKTKQDVLQSYRTLIKKLAYHAFGLKDPVAQKQLITLIKELENKAPNLLKKIKGEGRHKKYPIISIYIKQAELQFTDLQNESKKKKK